MLFKNKKEYLKILAYTYFKTNLLFAFLLKKILTVISFKTQKPFLAVLKITGQIRKNYS